ncbi:MAG: ATP synthase F0 subunit B [Butyrivibrio sp.]|nr:ATP synthase F0 subunit B [Butyrivibrio sp.]
MLSVSVMNVIYIIINLLILFALMKIFLFKRVDKVLEERKAEIENATNEMNTKSEEAEKIKAEYNEKLRGIDAQKEQVLSESRTKAYEEYDKIISDAKSEASSILADARKNAEMESQREKDAYTAELTDIVLDAASKISASNHTKEEDLELYDKFIKAAKK